MDQMIRRRSGTRAPLVSALGVAAALLAAIATAPAARAQSVDFSAAPPVVQSMTLTPTSSTSAVFEVVYKQDPRLSSTITIDVQDKPVVLNRSATGAPSFTGNIPFDFDQFEQEQAARQSAASQSIDVFDQREFLDSQAISFIDPNVIAAAVANLRPIPIPIGIGLGGPIIIHPDEELFITDPSVVQDPTRTFDACTGVGNPNGAWTFGTLMTAMANQPLTGVNPAVFVKNWLDLWTVNQTVNQWNVGARPIGAPTNLLGFWPVVGGQLDLTHAPLRLLAIVNRIDLRTNGVYGGGNAGEGRFIFQVVEPPSALNHNTCTPQKFTVILEYGVPINGCFRVHAWAAQWHALDALAFGPAYNAALQAITNTFAAANANPAKENGSALDQLRTDEIQLAPPWQLRQFELGSATNGLPLDNMLHEAPVTQTPETSLNNTARIKNYLVANNAAILAGTYVVPAQFPAGRKFLGGSSENLQQPWNGVPSQPTNARNLFSLNTCNGCHGAETQTLFLHAGFSVPFPPGVPAQLSQFLLGKVPPSTLAAPGLFTIPDPVSGVPRTYGDLVRRETGLAALLASTCFAGALLTDIQFLPLDAAD